MQSSSVNAPTRRVMSNTPRAVRGGDMGKITVTAFITLDNVVEEPQLWSGAFQSDDTGDYNSKVLFDADAMLLGRATYEGFAAAWPSRSGDRFSDRFNAMPKYVVSGTLEKADWNNSTIIRGLEEIPKDQKLLVWGSPTLVQGLMDSGLVDEFELLVSPIVRGKGIRLFRDGSDQYDLKIANATVLSGGMLALRMNPAGG
jgi:dihydrofolate reductase